jgi:hypothetical protein
MKLPFEINCRGRLVEKEYYSTPIAKYLAKNKIALGLALSAPIRRNLDYGSLARKVFVVDQLPQGALPFYKNEE